LGHIFGRYPSYLTPFKRRGFQILGGEGFFNRKGPFGGKAFGRRGLHLGATTGF